jgi:uncharacterized membrane protein YphA (DoxX/SURF4 family)
MKTFKEALKWNRILLGLLMLVGGLTKLFMMGPAGLTKMLTGLGFPVAGLLAWGLIGAELGSGIAILTKWKLDHVAYVPVVIVLAAIVMYWKNPMFAGKLPLQLTQTFVHITLASNYYMLGTKYQ